MKKTLHTLIALFSACIFLNSCKLDTPVFPDGASFDNNVSASTDTYHPLTSGSNWRYQDETGGTTETTVVTMTGKTNTINGKTYYEASAVNSQGTELINFYQGNHNYMEYNGDFIPGLGLELMYLNDAESVGYTWTNNLVDNGGQNLFSSKLTGRIAEKNITKTVLGKTYGNVIHTHIELEVTLLGTPNVAKFDFYMAKGIGYIEIDADDGTDISTSKLVDYTIK